MMLCECWFATPSAVLVLGHLHASLAAKILARLLSRSVCLLCMSIGLGDGRFLAGRGLGLCACMVAAHRICFRAVSWSYLLGPHSHSYSAWKAPQP
eukprot:53930-Amphidinium_carterae.4